jgi:hypothetical protein
MDQHCGFITPLALQLVWVSSDIYFWAANADLCSRSYFAWIFSLIHFLTLTNEITARWLTTQLRFYPRMILVWSLLGALRYCVYCSSLNRTEVNYRPRGISGVLSNLSVTKRRQWAEQVIGSQLIICLLRRPARHHHQCNCRASRRKSLIQTSCTITFFSPTPDLECTIP